MGCSSIGTVGGASSPIEIISIGQAIEYAAKKGLSVIIIAGGASPPIKTISIDYVFEYLTEGFPVMKAEAVDFCFDFFSFN